VIYPNRKKDSWKVEVIQKSPETMESRKLFPEKWRGLLDNDLRLKETTGVSHVIFCHKNGFLITVVSKAGAIALAQKALLEPSN
jgi:uncharacterized UPF0160 family protein